MSFLETQFPTSISFGSSGGPMYSTIVKTFNSGAEQRRVRWAYPRCKYNVRKGTRTTTQLETLINFFNAVQGKAHGFRYSDPLDRKTCSVTATPAGTDQVIIASAVGGEQNGIQLVKNYTLLGQTVSRPIKKPITGTVLIYKNGSPTAASIDYTTGLINLSAALVATDTLTWGGEFDIPCRFDTDYLPITLAGDIVGDTEIPVIEIMT